MAVPVRLPVITPAFIVTPEIAVAEATYKLPPIPTPPVTTRAPEVVDVDAVADLIDTPVPTISIGMLEELSIPKNILVLPTRLKVVVPRAKAELGGTTLKRVNSVDPMPNSPP